MKNIIVFFLIVFFLSKGCMESSRRDLPDSWKTLILVSEHDTKITINNDNDTSVVNIYHVGSFFSPLPKNTKVKVDTIKTYFTMAEKDTLFKLAKDLILNPAKTHCMCTEYVGELKLSIEYGQFRQRGEYTSVCNWNTLSEKTMHLHNLLKKKIKGIYLGENKI